MGNALSSCDVTGVRKPEGIWRRSPMRLSRKCLGVKINAKRHAVELESGSCFSRYVRGMIIEDQLDGGAGWISGVETLEEFDKLRLRWRSLTRAWTLPVSRSIPATGSACHDVCTRNPREGRVDAGLGRQMAELWEWLRQPGFRLFVVGDNRHSIDGFARLDGSFFRTWTSR